MAASGSGGLAAKLSSNNHLLRIGASGQSAVHLFSEKFCGCVATSSNDTTQQESSASEWPQLKRFSYLVVTPSEIQ